MIDSASATTVVQGFTLKLYRVCLAPPGFDAVRFAGFDRLVDAVLRQVQESDEVPRMGFVIQHQGRTADYLVLAWWTRQNELALRVWVNDGPGWRPAGADESICVWDLEIIWFERNLWIDTGLSGRDLSVALPEYASRRFRPNPDASRGACTR
ncbi:MAG TPA: hypothetical protein VFO19_16035 [Vicinamibacterales bacterium]|nr:hypothetical protein [Vicinamibacterales bacterium]